MSKQPSLFDAEELPLPASSSTAVALAIAGSQLGPEQKAFNQWLRKIEERKQELVQIEALLNQYRSEYASRTGPLRMQCDALTRQLVTFLDERLRAKGLTKNQRATLEQLVCNMALNQLDGPDGDQMKEIYNRHSPVDLDTEKDQEAEEMRAAFAEVFGVDVGDGIDSPDEMLDEVNRKFEQAAFAREQARAERASKRKRSAKQIQQEQEQLDAGKTLREVYRKLASALHPDREPDEVERRRKTELMGQVNAANDRKDLLALLQLQMQIEQIHPEAIGAMADEKLRHFNRVLKEQHKALDSELRDMKDLIRLEFGLGYGALNEKSLETALRAQVASLQSNITWIRQELIDVRTDPGLKAWIREQHRSMQLDGEDLAFLINLGKFDGRDPF